MQQRGHVLLRGVLSPQGGADGSGAGCPGRPPGPRPRVPPGTLSHLSLRLHKSDPPDLRGSSSPAHGHVLSCPPLSQLPGEAWHVAGQCSAPQDPGTLASRTPRCWPPAPPTRPCPGTRSPRGAHPGQGRTRHCVLFSARESRWLANATFSKRYCTKTSGTFSSEASSHPGSQRLASPRRGGFGRESTPRVPGPGCPRACHGALPSRYSQLRVWTLAHGGCAWPALSASSPATLGSP